MVTDKQAINIDLKYESGEIIIKRRKAESLFLHVTLSMDLLSNPTMHH